MECRWILQEPLLCLCSALGPAAAATSSASSASSTTATAATSAAIVTSAATSATALVAGLTEVERQVLLAIHLATADPYLDTDGSHLGVSGLHRVVDIGTEGVERDAALLEGLAACHLGVIETAVEEYLDTLGTGTHGVTDGIAGGTAVIDTTLDLAGDAVGDDSSSMSGRRTSKILIWTSLSVIFLSSSLSLSTSLPPGPMIRPGRAVQMVMVMSLRVRSMTMRATPLSVRRALR